MSRGLLNFPALQATYNQHPVGSAEYNLAIISDNKYNRRVSDRASREGNLEAWSDAERAIEHGDNLLACAPTIEELAASVERARTHAEPNQKREALNLASELAASLVKRQGIEAVPTEYRPLVMHMQLSWANSRPLQPLVETMPSLARSNSSAPPQSPPVPTPAPPQSPDAPTVRLSRSPWNLAVAVRWSVSWRERSGRLGRGGGWGG